MPVWRFADPVCNATPLLNSIRYMPGVCIGLCKVISRKSFLENLRKYIYRLSFISIQIRLDVLYFSGESGEERREEGFPLKLRHGHHTAVNRVKFSKLLRLRSYMSEI